MRILILASDDEVLEDYEVDVPENLQQRGLKTEIELASDMISTLENTYDME